MYSIGNIFYIFPTNTIPFRLDVAHDPAMDLRADPVVVAFRVTWITNLAFNNVSIHIAFATDIQDMN
jgi:hypothetical protein